MGGCGREISVAAPAALVLQDPPSPPPFRGTCSSAPQAQVFGAPRHGCGNLAARVQRQQRGAVLTPLCYAICASCPLPPRCTHRPRASPPRHRSSARSSCPRSRAASRWSTSRAWATSRPSASRTSSPSLAPSLAPTSAERCSGARRTASARARGGGGGWLGRIPWVSRRNTSAVAARARGGGGGTLVCRAAGGDGGRGEAVARVPDGGEACSNRDQTPATAKLNEADALPSPVRLCRAIGCVDETASLRFEDFVNCMAVLVRA